MQRSFYHRYRSRAEIFTHRKRAFAKKEVEEIVVSLFCEASISSRSLRMKVLITGICGFTGSTVAKALQDIDSTIELFGSDNFIRPGSERNRPPLQSAGRRCGSER
jgi:hypothetical protein